MCLLSRPLARRRLDPRTVSVEFTVAAAPVLRACPRIGRGATEGTPTHQPAWTAGGANPPRRPGPAWSRPRRAAAAAARSTTATPFRGSRASPQLVTFSANRVSTGRRVRRARAYESAALILAAVSGGLRWRSGQSSSSANHSSHRCSVSSARPACSARVAAPHRIAVRCAAEPPGTMWSGGRSRPTPWLSSSPTRLCPEIQQRKRRTHRGVRPHLSLRSGLPAVRPAAWSGCKRRIRQRCPIG
jgi:hypothetical protein